MKAMMQKSVPHVLTCTLTLALSSLLAPTATAATLIKPGDEPTNPYAHIDLRYGSNNKLALDLLFPFIDIPIQTKQSLYFFQGGVSRYKDPINAIQKKSDRLLVNTGIGWRYMPTPRWMTTVYGFYDWEFQNGLGRLSIGTALRSDWMQLAANYYHQGRSKRTDSKLITQKAAGGCQVVWKGWLPRVPWIQLHTGLDYYGGTLNPLDSEAYQAHHVFFKDRLTPAQQNASSEELRKPWTAALGVTLRPHSLSSIQYEAKKFSHQHSSIDHSITFRVHYRLGAPLKQQFAFNQLKNAQALTSNWLTPVHRSDELVVAYNEKTKPTMDPEEKELLEDTYGPALYESEGATLKLEPSEIKERYKKNAMKLHPDKNLNEPALAKEVFSFIAACHEEMLKEMERFETVTININPERKPRLVFSRGRDGARADKVVIVEAAVPSADKLKEINKLLAAGKAQSNPTIPDSSIPVTQASADEKAQSNPTIPVTQASADEKAQSEQISSNKRNPMLCDATPTTLETALAKWNLKLREKERNHCQSVIRLLATRDHNTLMTRLRDGMEDPEKTVDDIKLLFSELNAISENLTKPHRVTRSLIRLKQETSSPSLGKEIDNLLRACPATSEVNRDVLRKKRAAWCQPAIQQVNSILGKLNLNFSDETQEGFKQVLNLAQTLGELDAIEGLSHDLRAFGKSAAYVLQTFSNLETDLKLLQAEDIRSYDANRTATSPDAADLPTVATLSSARKRRLA